MRAFCGRLLGWQPVCHRWGWADGRRQVSWAGGGCWGWLGWAGGGAGGRLGWRAWSAVDVGGSVVRVHGCGPVGGQPGWAVAVAGGLDGWLSRLGVGLASGGWVWLGWRGLGESLAMGVVEPLVVLGWW